MTLSLDRLLQTNEANAEAARKLADAVITQAAASNRLADAAKKLGDLVRTRTPDDRQVAEALDHLAEVTEGLVIEQRKIKQRVTALALQQGAISEDAVTGVYPIPKAPAGGPSERTSRPPPVARAVQAWGALSLRSQVFLVLLALILTSSGWVVRAIERYAGAPTAALHRSEPAAIPDAAKGQIP